MEGNVFGCGRADCWCCRAKRRIDRRLRFEFGTFGILFPRLGRVTFRLLPRDRFVSFDAECSRRVQVDLDAFHFIAGLVAAVAILLPHTFGTFPLRAQLILYLLYLIHLNIRIHKPAIEFGLFWHTVKRRVQAVYVIKVTTRVAINKQM